MNYYKKRKFGPRKIMWVVIGIAVGITMFSIMLVDSANAAPRTCTLVKGALVGQLMPTGKVRVGLHPFDTEVTIVEPISPTMTSQLINITKVTDWGNGQVVTFKILPDKNNKGVVQQIYVFTRLIDLRQCQ